ncbi:restriction endonuclease subunit S [Vibrio parahaemolyticus]|uniref:restriction endonuclease subunit S n=1 Tax=Vibrio parahaemolyticus TaxID=670 RepID=UPI0013025BFF|nr:restriction endonuclease subunit S [Vibrio parahaemolyticus]EGQ8105410.1 restriction endonuclease subunit S [Vibrio parahaemolyticus]EJB0368852.1 restriction endonuclease subunit S [Vibrio parahaemolyticus]MBE4319993.1 restriction endonuclease subunit S [Vibrio parahaemolyticus]MBE4338356.1 restriction endonuclease subunit S [Vibrio parahaemolyticus]MDF5654784.1 restriction endonuclease subunit S [Vibrio parahaemolyticus]
MSFEIKKATLGDFLNFKNGKKSPERADNASFPVFGSNGLIGRAELTNCPENTIVIGRVGSYCGSVHFSKEKCWVSDNAISCSSKSTGEEHFWFYVLTKLNLNQFSSGSGQPLLNQATLNAVECEVPNNSSIRALIGDVLNDYDKKIKLNAATNETLEEMAQAIFKSWFVDFEPLKAKMNGEQPEGMDAATASLFPEKLVESELGLIPEGWEIQKTQDLFEVKDGTHDSPKKAEEGHYLVTSKHITKGKIDTSSAYLISDADFDKVNQRSKVDTFDILLTMIGTVGEVVVVYDNPVEFAIKNVGLFKTSQRPELVWLFYWHLQSFKMKHYLEVRMAGTTQQYLTLKTLRTIPVVLPSNELLVKFNEVMSPLMEKISDNHKQNQTLSNLRDTLLPKLLSGEIELGQAQELAEVE